MHWYATYRRMIGFRLDPDQNFTAHSGLNPDTDQEYLKTDTDEDEGQRNESPLPAVNPQSAVQSESNEYPFDFP